MIVKTIELRRMGAEPSTTVKCDQVYLHNSNKRNGQTNS